MVKSGMHHWMIVRFSNELQVTISSNTDEWIRGQQYQINKVHNIRRSLWRDIHIRSIDFDWKKDRWCLAPRKMFNLFLPNVFVFLWLQCDCTKLNAMLFFFFYSLSVTQNPSVFTQFFIQKYVTNTLSLCKKIYHMALHLLSRFTVFRYSKWTEAIVTVLRFRRRYIS